MTILVQILWFDIFLLEGITCILQESFVDEGLAQLEGESLGDMLDFLSKELIRLQVRDHVTLKKKTLIWFAVSLVYDHFVKKIVFK